MAAWSKNAPTSGKPSDDNIPDDLKCPRCNKLMDDERKPKTLECGHVVCEKCLKEQRSKHCPFCQTDLKNVPRDTEFISMKVAEYLKKRRQTDEGWFTVILHPMEGGQKTVLVRAQMTVAEFKNDIRKNFRRATGNIYLVCNRHSLQDEKDGKVMTLGDYEVTEGMTVTATGRGLGGFD
jgi:hypothetical protein